MDFMNIHCLPITHGILSPSLVLLSSSAEEQVLCFAMGAMGPLNLATGTMARAFLSEPVLLASYAASCSGSFLASNTSSYILQQILGCWVQPTTNPKGAFKAEPGCHESWQFWRVACLHNSEGWLKARPNAWQSLNAAPADGCLPGQ